MNKLTEKQFAVLSDLKYLPWPDGKQTLGDFWQYYDDLKTDDPQMYTKLKVEKRQTSLDALEGDNFLKSLPLEALKENKITGFSAWALGVPSEDKTTPSKDGVVVYEGSKDISEIFTGGWPVISDWLNNLMALGLPISPQEIDAANFAKGLDFENIDYTGHSLGGYLATISGLFDSRANSATPFNAYGSLNPLKLLANLFTGNKDKIDGFRSSGDIASLTDLLFNPKTLAGNDNGFWNLFDGHDMENILKGIGIMDTDINPFGSLIESLATLMGRNEEMREALTTAWTEIQEKCGEVWGGVKEKVMEVVPDIITTIVGFFLELPGKIWEHFENIVISIGDWISNATAKAQEVLPGFIEAVVNFFLELPGKIWTHFENIVISIGDWISNSTEKAKELLPDCIETVVGFFLELPGKIWTHFENIVTNIGDWISNATDKAKEVIPGFITEVVNFFLELPGKIWTHFENIVIKIGDWISNATTKAQEELPGFVEKVVSFFLELPEKTLQAGKDLVEGLFNGISNARDWLYGKLRGWVDNVVDYIKGLFGINSPSKLMRDTVGVGIAEGVAVGISENTDLVEDAMSDMADVVAATDLSVEPELNSKSLDFAAFKEKLRPHLDSIMGYINSAQNAMATQFSASTQLAAAYANAGMNNTYNNGATFNNSYTITAANTSPKATADAIKNQMTMQRMLFATR